MSSLDRAFFRAYAKDQPVAADAEPIPATSGASPYVYFQSPRKPQLRYRIEPTHTPWGAAAPEDAATIEAPQDESDYRLAASDESASTTAWSSEGDAYLAVARETSAPAPTTAAEVVARSTHTMPSKSAPADPYADGIVCLPGMGVPESSYLAAFVAEVPAEEEISHVTAPTNVQIVEPVLHTNEREASRAVEPAVADTADQPREVADRPAAAKDRASLLADEPTAFWEVDRYLYPTISDRLLSRYEYFAHAGDKLKQAAQAGLKLLGITGVGRDEGRSTLAICLARAAARSGLKVALVDCDFRHPRLAQLIGLEVSSGWEAVAQDDVALAEVSIRSLEDGILLLPLLDEAKTSTLSLSDDRVTHILTEVRQSYDVVILDAGPSESAGEPSHTSSLDAAIVVWDRRRRKLEEAEAVARRLSSTGVQAVGIAENFAG